MIRTLLVLSALVLALVLGAAGCGVATIHIRNTDTPVPASAFGPPCTTPTVTMGISTFDGCRNLDITSGTAVQFVDPASTVATPGGFHILVTGANGQYQSSPGAPDALNNPAGVTFHPGDAQTITFLQAGVYTVTCTLHPNMIVQITVTG